MMMMMMMMMIDWLIDWLVICAADGYCRSEAIVAVLLQKREEAKRIYATVVNTKQYSDGYKDQGIIFVRKSQYLWPPLRL